MSTQVEKKLTNVDSECEQIEKDVEKDTKMIQTTDLPKNENKANIIRKEENAEEQASKDIKENENIKNNEDIKENEDNET